MNYKIFTYPAVIRESYLDSFGHMNNAYYLNLFEEARWELMNESGYSIAKIRESGLGPTLLELSLHFLKELKARDEIIIETNLLSYERKIGKIEQRMMRGAELCCQGQFTIALFSLQERKLVAPTFEWMKTLTG